MNMNRRFFSSVIVVISIIVILFFSPDLVIQGAERSAAHPERADQQISNDTNASSSAFSCSSVTEIPLIECQALIALYNSTNGASWINHTDWLVTNTPCNWFGVACLNNHVYLLALSGNQLRGGLPPQIGDFPEMLGIYMADNQLGGSIPTQLSNLPKLIDLNLTNNQLNGSIPAQLGSLPSLYFLDLNNNQLSGNIPSQLVGHLG
jgi:hypothetical protein